MHCRLPTNWFSDPSQCLFEWQTLISGGLALAAAGLTVIYLKKQIIQSDEFHRIELRREHNAARSVLPVALAAISEFCNEIAEQVATAIEDRNKNDFNAGFEENSSGGAEQKIFVPVSLPGEVITTMKDFVETLSDSPNVRHVAELLSSLQILQARFCSFDLQQIGVLHSLYSLLLDAAKVKLLTDSIYNYGRFVDENCFSIVNQESFDAAWKSIQGKAQGLVFMRKNPDYFFPEINRLVSSYKDNQVSPWNEKFGD